VVRSSSEALTEVSAGGESSEGLDAAVAETHDWLGPSEAAIEMWAEGGDVAFQRTAPCLGAALGRIREELVGLEREVPEVLEQAEAEALAAGERPCGE